MTERCDLDLLALFPSFETRDFGGVQKSGREAWNSIESHKGVSADAFFYDDRNGRIATVRAAIRRRAQVHTVLVWHSDLLRLVPFITSRNRRVVLFLHGIEAWRLQDRITAHLMRRANLFLSNSDHTWRRFLSFQPHFGAAAHKTVHLGTGCRIECIKRPQEDTPAGLMIGRLSKDDSYKGHREIIQLWPRVIEQMPGAELWIVGVGDLRSELEQMASALRVSQQVRFFGAVSEGEKEILIRKCRALFLPSTCEGFGLVYLEAMRMGRPCLVSTLDAGIEVVNPPEAGLAVHLNDPGETVDGLLRLLTLGPEWDRMSERARERYENGFTARHFEQRLLSALFDD